MGSTANGCMGLFVHSLRTTLTTRFYREKLGIYRAISNTLAYTHHTTPKPKPCSGRIFKQGSKWNTQSCQCNRETLFKTFKQHIELFIITTIHGQWKDVTGISLSYPVSNYKHLVRIGRILMSQTLAPLLFCIIQ